MIHRRPRTLNILIADDDKGDCAQIRHVLRQAGLAYECIETASIEGALEACDNCAIDCAIIDYRMPGHDGLHGIAALHERHPHMPIIMVTGKGDELVAADAMKRGASDYIPKMHIHAESMRHVIESAMEKAALRRKVAQQREELENFASVLVHDVKALEVKVHEARIDHLTGLASRPLFLEQAAALRMRCAKNDLATAILFIDLDGFKAINDRFGHDHGDAVLAQTAQVLRASVRDTDIAGRVGGDEFVVCLAAPSKLLETTATNVAKRIVKKIAEIGGSIGCSVGIALTGSDTVDLETAIRQADEAMYAAKRSGKNRFMIHGRPRTLNILIADDDDADRKQVRRALRRAGLACECIETASIEGALEACEKLAFDCAIVDYRMPGHDGLHGISALHERLPYMPIIMVTGQGDEMIATEAMKRGASDYIPKMHIRAESMRRVIESALEKATLQRKVAQQREELAKFASVLVDDLKAPIGVRRAAD